MKTVKEYVKQKWYICMGICMGIVVFLITYGVTPLDVTNDAWIMAGYDEADIIQHYAGWVQYRNSDWTFPFGMAENLAIGDGTTVSYTDSIPWLAILFKAFRSILPETFQYFGIAVLAWFILQGVASAKLLHRIDNHRCFLILGTFLFVFAPILLERSFRHTGLGAQWLVLFSIYYYLEYRKSFCNGIGKLPWQFLLLNVLAVGIHPYFLPMVMIFTLLTAVEWIRYQKEWIKSGAFFVINLVASALAGWIIGAIGWGGAYSRLGYGSYSMNLNAFFNPVSVGGYSWSKFLRAQNQNTGQTDGFNYFGVGILLLIFLVFALAARKFFEERRFIAASLRKNIWLLAGLLFLTIFALSNKITFNYKTLLEIPLPGFLNQLCGIFRASSRMFYPVWYCILYWALSRWWNHKADKKYRIVMLSLVALTQIYDMYEMVIDKHNDMRVNAAFESVLDDDALRELAQGRKELVADVTIATSGIRELAVWAGKNGLSTSFTVAGTGDFSKSDYAQYLALADVAEGHAVEDYVYMTMDAETYADWREIYSNSATFVIYGDYYFMALSESDAE